LHLISRTELPIIVTILQVLQLKKKKQTKKQTNKNTNKTKNPKKSKPKILVSEIVI